MASGMVCNVVYAMANLMAFPVDSDLMPRHVPPSRIRYEKRNPMIAVRLTESMRKTLDAARKDSALSYADLDQDGA
jgi:hypothetical protein